MRGKPKGIRRKDAADKDTTFEKALVSMYGDQADWDESLFYDRLKSLFWAEEHIGTCKKKPTEVFLFGRHVPLREFNRQRVIYQKYAAETFELAVKNNNVRFFQRLAAIAQWHGRGKRPVDELGFLVLFAQDALKKLNKPHTSKAIAAYIEDQMKRRIDDAIIRRTLRQLGLGKPIKEAAVST